MGDVSTARLICVRCGLPILDDDAVVGPAEPDAIHAGERVCIARLREELDGARRHVGDVIDAAQRAARTRDAELAASRRDLAAALAVVRAARIVRVRYRREERAEKLYTRAYYAPGVFPAELAEERRRAYDESCDAREVLVAATTAYVKGGAR